MVGGGPAGEEKDDDEALKEPMLPPPANQMRLACWNIVRRPEFDTFILICIALNCFFMAIEDPNYKGDDENGGNILYFDISYDTNLLVGRILLYIFTVEAMLKNLAFTPWGYLFGPDANWNRLDFFIVVVGWLEEYPDYLGSMPFNVSFLRIFRVFRPLRTLGKMKNMKVLINTLFICFDPLVDVLNLTLFVFFVFSVLGMELFQGQASQRCILPLEGFVEEYPNTDKWVILSDAYTYPIEGRTCGGDFTCPEVPEGTMRMGEEIPAGKYECYHLGRNPDQGILKQNQADGIIGYDNLPQAMLTVFVFCTLEGWVGGMYQYQDSFGWAVATLYHIFMILLGTFFCMNLALAVIADTFEEEFGEEEDEEDAEGDDLEKVSEDGDEGGEKRVEPPNNPLQYPFWQLSYNSYFNNFITLLIILNAITLAMEHARRDCLAIETENIDYDSWTKNGFTGEQPDCILQAQTMSESHANFLIISNYFFVVAFAIELVVKMIGLRPYGYFSDPFNTFDFIIVVVSFVEILINIKGLTALRCFRLARVFKMARSWGSLRAIIESLLAVLPAMTSLIVMLLLYMFIAAVAGMQMMGGKKGMEEDRSRFTDFGISLLTVFQMLTGEDWNEVMFAAIRSSPGSHDWTIVIYFVLIVLIGAFLVLNMFLAIMLSDFNCGDPPDFSINNAMKTFCPFLLKEEEDVSDVESEPPLETASESNFFSPNQMKNHMTKDQEAKIREKSMERKKKLESQNKKGSQEMVKIQEDLQKQEREDKEAEKQRLDGVALNVFTPDSSLRQKFRDIVRHPLFDSFILLCIIIGSVLLAVNGPTNNDETSTWKTICYLEFSFVVIFTIEAVMKIIVLGFYWESKDAYLKDPWNWLDFVVVIVGWLTNDCLVMLPVNGESVGALRTLRVLRVLRPLRVIQRMPGMRLVVAVLFECAPVFINICFVVFFFFAVFAIMGVQFFKGQFWSCNDSSVANVDECWGCFDHAGEGDDSDNCPAGFGEREWANAPMTFDNVYVSLLTLYEVAGLEIWLDILYSGMDSVEDCELKKEGEKKYPFGCQPMQETRWEASWYFIFFILVGVFIVMNLFVGAVVDKFNELKEANGGRNPLQTEEQAKYSESMSLMVRMRPIRVPVAPQPPNKKSCLGAMTIPWWKFRISCYKIVMWDTSGKGMGTTFDMIISLMVMLNILVMGLYQWKRLGPGEVMEIEENCKSDDDYPCPIQDHQETNLYEGLEMLNNIFTGIFLVEMLLKFAAWGLTQYFIDYWNQLDFILVVMSVLGFIVEIILTGGAFPLNPAVFRIVRVARLTRALKSIRMVRRIKGVARLVDTLVIAIPAMGNVASLCFLIIFIFAVMGMDFFGSDEVDGPNAAKVYGMYNQHANFRYFGDAFMLLFRSVTGEAWNGVMHDMMKAECDMQMYPDKHKYQPGDKEYDPDWCGTPHQSSPWIFFLLIQTFITGLLFELVTAIVLDEFSKMNKNEELPVNGDMISNFNEHWAQLDPKATQMIPQYKLLPFLKSVSPPIFESEEEAKKEIFNMNIVVNRVSGCLMVQYVDTLVAVTRYLYVKDLGEQIGRELDVAMIESPELTTRIISAYPHLKKIDEMDTKDFKEELAASRMQGALQKKSARKRADAQKTNIRLQYAKIKNIEVKKTSKGGYSFPKDIEKLSVDEMKTEIIKSGSSIEIIPEKEHSDVV